MTLILGSSGRRRGPYWISQPYTRVDTGVRWLASHAGTAYGVTAGNTWATTQDGSTITDTGTTALYGGQPPIDMHVDTQGYVVHTAGGIDVDGIPYGTGAVWLGTNLGNLVNRTPTNWTPDTCGRNSVVDRVNGVLLVGQYSYVNSDAYVHRSTDDGQTWTWDDLQDTRISSGYTRHVHGLHFDRKNPDVAWATVGDDPGGPRGLYKSTDAGATWSIITNTEYPIDFDFMSDGLFVGEGDGKNRAHIVTWREGDAAFTEAITPAMAEAATGQTDWRGTTRGLTVLNGDSIFYYTTAEQGVTGTRWGLWRATRTEGAWTPHLLEELPGRILIMGKGINMGSFLLCHRYRITVPLP